MIIFDSTYLVVYLNPNPLPATDREGKPVQQFKERVAHLAAKLDVSNQVIGVPAPAMAEVLVRAGNGRAQLVSVLSDRWRFQILPFDSRAAIEASELIAAVKSNKEKGYLGQGEIRYTNRIHRQGRRCQRDLRRR